ncbi:MAG: hypothetical protein ABJN72_02125, partial [Sulfitobacter sp.]
FQRELIKQRRLCLLLWSHHRQIPRFYRGIETVKALQINKSFSTEFAHTVEKLRFWQNQRNLCPHRPTSFFAARGSAQLAFCCSWASSMRRMANLI